MRNTLVIIFINKMDSEGQNPFDLLDELEEKLFIHTRPLKLAYQQWFNIFRGLQPSP